jgi:polyisoprenoid-binding protein YceI
MTSRMKVGGSVVMLLGTAIISGSTALPSYQFTPESRLWVEGTSTIRDFTCQAGELTGTIEAGSGIQSLAIPDLETAVRKVDVVIPVAALDCNNETMNTHMRKALKATQNPTIQYRLSTYDVVPGEGNEARLRLNGTLAVAGQEKSITMNATAIYANGTLRVQGAWPIVMTEWGMTPPSLMLGTIKVRDRLMVNFDVVLKP